MHSLPQQVQNLIDQFVRLPGIGPKTASRLVMFLLHSPQDYLKNFGRTLADIKDNVKFCRNCYNLADTDRCSVCSDETRELNRILVVEDVLDLMAFENISEYKGLYHVLGGVISPMQGVGPEDLNVGRLLERIREYPIDSTNLEVIIATNPNLEGEATSLYLKEELLSIKPNILISRIARGLPTGAELDYADRVTLLRSLEGRVVL